MRISRKTWRCFHCDEVFRSPAEARLHFGADQGHDPICKLRMPGEYHLLNILRDQEQQLERYRAEDSEVMRAMHSMHADHAAALRGEEEKGYARGLRDANHVEPQPFIPACSVCGEPGCPDHM